MRLFPFQRGSLRLKDRKVTRKGKKVRLQMEPLEDRWLPSQILIVNSTGDGSFGGGTVTLRDAINAVNLDTNATAASPDYIQFAIGSGAQTIHLRADLPAIRESVIIDGTTQPGFTGVSLITVDGSSLYQPFTEILSGVNTTTVTLNSVNIAHGMTAGSGGGILNHGALTLINSTITGNSAALDGGGIWNDGLLTVSNCTITNNTAGRNGGGLFNKGTTQQNGGSMTVSGNTAGVDGGGVFNSGGTIQGMFHPSTKTTDPATNWTIQGNTADDNGGGIFNAGSFTLNNSLIASNQAIGTNGSALTDRGDVGDGGGAYNSAALTLTNTAVTGNLATGGGINGKNGGTTPSFNSGGNGGNGGSGGGIYNVNGTLDLVSSLVSGNTASGTGGSGGNGGSGGSYGNYGGNGGDGGSGGGIENFKGSVYVTNSTVANNTVGGTGGAGGAGGTGGGVYSYNLGGNGGNGGSGGGINNVLGTVVLTDATVAGNTVGGGTAGAGGTAGSGAPGSVSRPGGVGSGGAGGGINNSADSPGSVTVESSIVATNAAATGADIAAFTIKADCSLIGDGSGIGGGGVTGANGTAVGNKIGTKASPINPLLGQLRNNGGPVQTMALLPGSPGIGTGMSLKDPFSKQLLTTDERGYARPTGVGAAVDMGAFQNRGYTLTVVGNASQTVSVGQTVTLPFWLRKALTILCPA